MPGTQIYVVAPLDSTYEGPVAPGPNGEEQQIHLLQGSLDGACGPLCVLMGLLAMGVVDRDEVIGARETDGRTRLGRLFKACTKHGPFVRQGTNLRDLVEMLRRSFGRQLMVEFFQPRSGARGRHAFIRRHVLADHVVVQAIHFQGGGHWVLVVGIESECTGRGDSTLCRLLVLDPGFPAPTVSAWNGVVDARGSGGPYPFTWWTNDLTKVKLADAAALWRCPEK